MQGSEGVTVRRAQKTSNNHVKEKECFHCHTQGHRLQDAPRRNSQRRTAQRRDNTAGTLSQWKVESGKSIDAPSINTVHAIIGADTCTARRNVHTWLARQLLRQHHQYVLQCNVQRSIKNGPALTVILEFTCSLTRCQKVHAMRFEFAFSATLDRQLLHLSRKFRHTFGRGIICGSREMRNRRWGRVDAAW